MAPATSSACLSAGARESYLIEEPTGSMIVDVGGTTEVPVISLGGIVVSQSIRVGGDELDEEIVNYCKHRYKLAIGAQTAEEVKLVAGSAPQLPAEVETRSAAADLVSGLPKTITLGSEWCAAHSTSPSGTSSRRVKDTLDRTPPELPVTSWNAKSRWREGAPFCKA